MSKASQKVIKYTHLEHVLKVPDTYVGSIESTQEEHYVLNDDGTKMVKKTINYTPGEYKIFDEILVNALDHYVRIKEKNIQGHDFQPVKNIKVNFDQEQGFISVTNDGEGIPIELHESENIYVPELIFGHLLTSGNYEKKQKHTGGKNGYGGKLTNIFSKEFIVETIDHNQGKKYTQRFYNNMADKDKPKITSNKGKPYTKITYYPDFERFGHKSLEKDMIRLITKRTYDAAAVTDPSVNIYLNDKKLEFKSFEKYTDLYLGDKTEVPRHYQEFSSRWAVCVAVNPTQQFEQVSFVNGITTYQGGKHVDYITNQVCKKLAEYIEKKKKIKVKTSHIKENIFVFIRTTIDDPSFNSQIKEFLTTPQSKFGSKCDMDDKFIDKLAKMGLMDTAINLSNFKENKDLKKTDGKKKSTIRGIPKLDDANWAGGPKSDQCTLILTEGDSAKSLAISGLEIIGRDKYGVFPLRGKVLNVKGDDKNMGKKIAENAEITNLKKIMGLQSDKKYTSTKDLRYGSVMLMTDQDEDGSHIKGLLFNLFQSLWPGLFKMDGFNKSMLTPIVKASKGKQIKSFYNLSDYEKWKQEKKGWTIKYYKGLGTSTPKEAKEYFRDMKIVNYIFEEEKSDEAIELAFNKKRSDDRKKWLAEYQRENVLDFKNSNVTHRDFINRELIHFSNSDNRRSIPSVIDGLKTSHRKILYCAFKKKLTHEIRVAQFAGYVSEHGGYHHGEASLQGAITNMAQDFVGSNNINILEPIGQFGSRIMGGSDSAQPRYIHTKLPDLTYKIYNKEDGYVLNYLDDDGFPVEPETYVPILPMILVNGGEGIGTGWSTYVPCYNPEDIIANLKRKLKGEEMVEIRPWYRGFTGKIEKLTEHSYLSRGKYRVEGDSKVIISELPVKMWTDKYKEFLESMVIETGKETKKPQYLRNYNSYCSDTSVNFELVFHKDNLYNLTYDLEQNDDGQNKFEKTFKLTSKINTSNMVLYDRNGYLKKYTSPLEIIDEYFEVRMECYVKRKAYLLAALEKELVMVNARVKFIEEFISGDIIIGNRSKADILGQLETREYPMIENSYDYLIKMPIYNLTKERIEELRKDRDVKMSDYKNLEGKTPHTMYREELDDFLKNYKQFLKVKESESQSFGEKKKIIKKKK
jgi:DNA topoisomerase II